MPRLQSPPRQTPSAKGVMLEERPGKTSSRIKWRSVMQHPAQGSKLDARKQQTRNKSNM